MSLHDLAVLAQAADAPMRHPGYIIGGWEYIWASWGIAWAGIALYALSLFLRRSKSSVPPNG